MRFPPVKLTLHQSDGPTLCCASFHPGSEPRGLLLVALIAATSIYTIQASETPLKAAGKKEAVRYEDIRVSMGCVYAIVVYANDSAPFRMGVEAAFDEIDRIDQLMSHYKPDSELSRINREAATSPIEVEPELFDFIVECLRYSRESDGAFDITVGPLMKAWGFFRGEGRMPSEAELAAARSRVGYQHVILDRKERTISFDKAGVELDLGGIAKGYAVDRAIEVLKKHGISAALVNAGGSTISTLGAPPGEAGWEVEIQDPLDLRKIATSVRLKNQTLSVSGGYGAFFELGGARYSHIMDPRSGRPVQGVLSVAVITNDGMSGDALDNVFYVLGIEKSQERLRDWPGVTAFVFLPEAENRWRLVRLPGGPATGEQESSCCSTFCHGTTSPVVSASPSRQSSQRRQTCQRPEHPWRFHRRILRP